MLRLLARKVTPGGRRREDGYHGAEIRDYGVERAQAIITAGCHELGVTLEELRSAAKSDWRKALLAELVQSHTVTRLIGSGTPCAWEIDPVVADLSGKPGDRYSKVPTRANFGSKSLNNVNKP